MADLGDDEPVDCPWWELLLENPLFERLREEGYEQHTPGTSLVCEVRGDLFVWSQATTALFTTNLKRIKANPGQPQYFQVRMEIEADTCSFGGNGCMIIDMIVYPRQVHYHTVTYLFLPRLWCVPVPL